MANFEAEEHAFRDAVGELLSNQDVPEAIWLELVNDAITKASNYREALRHVAESSSDQNASQWEQTAAEVNSGLSFLVQAINDYRNRAYEG